MSPWISTAIALILLGLLLAILDRLCGKGGSLGAVTGVMIAEVWRKRFLPVTGLVLIIGLVLLPAILSVDTTLPEGRRTLLQYGQGWTGLVILTAILVMGCSTLSEERSSGRWGYLSLRPGLLLRWLPGKWLGGVGASLILVIPATWMMFSQIRNPAGDWENPRTVMPVTADQFSVTQEDIDLFLLLKIEESPLEWGQYSQEEARERARSVLIREARSIPLGTRAYVDFSLSLNHETQVSPGDPLRLSLRPAMGKAHRSQIARIRVEGDQFSKDLLVTNGQRTSVEVPGRLYRDGRVSLELEFLGAVAEDVVIPSLYWIDNNAVELQVPRGSLLGSLLRSQLLLLARCAFVSALSLTVSTFLGFPVATLLVFCFLLAATGGGFVGAFEETAPQTMVDRRQESYSRQIIDLLAIGGEKIVHSLGEWKRTSTAEQVSSGEFVSWKQVWTGCANLGGVWSGLSLLIGTMLLAKQEKSAGEDR